jgi:quercetin dioxygenase-like cupin family protein
MTKRLVFTALAIVAAVARPASVHAKDIPVLEPPKADQRMMSLNPKSVQYIAIPNMPACATAAILRGNPRFGPASVLLRLASGCRVPWHWHTANETMVVISGQGEITMEDGPPMVFAPGAYALLPARHLHMATCRRTCLFFNEADASFDIHYVDAKGKEIPLEQAMTPAATPKRRKK